MIHINIGSNLSSKFGTKLKNISIAINLLIDTNLKIKKISNFYETPSYPNKNFPKFLNIGILLEYKLTYKALFKKIDLIEKKIGRFKTKKNEPRVCDIDIIDFKGLIINKNKLQIPHSKLHVRNFVLYPLREIEPNWTHPVFNKKIDYFLKRLNLKSHIEITRLKKSVIL